MRRTDFDDTVRLLAAVIMKLDKDTVAGLAPV